VWDAAGGTASEKISTAEGSGRLVGSTPTDWGRPPPAEGLVPVGESPVAFSPTGPKRRVPRACEDLGWFCCAPTRSGAEKNHGRTSGERH
jgi:hypothetical protein